MFFAKEIWVQMVQFFFFFWLISQVAAYSDGHVRIYELLDPLELKNWQLQVILIGSYCFIILLFQNLLKCWWFYLYGELEIHKLQILVLFYDILVIFPAVVWVFFLLCSIALLKWSCCHVWHSDIGLNFVFLFMCINDISKLIFLFCVMIFWSCSTIWYLSQSKSSLLRLFIYLIHMSVDWDIDDNLTFSAYMLFLCINCLGKYGCGMIV